jgi:hypothetical protein
MISTNSTPFLKGWGSCAAAVMARLRVLAPYALMELILPGGSVMALLLWLYRRRKNGSGLGPLPTKLLAFLRLTGPLPIESVREPERAGCGLRPTSACGA